MDTKLLRQKILDLAIHGKLVPQNPQHEPASNLLERIRAESKKPDLSISEDEIPFEIPENWCWCRLGEVCYFQNGYAFKSSNFSEKGETKVIRISDITDGGVDTINCIHSTEKNIDSCFRLEKGDLVIAMSGGTTGKNGVFNSNDETYINQRVGNIKIRDSKVLYDKYRNFYIQCKEKEIYITAYGGAQPNISGNKICEMLLPLPPLEEQKLIVAEIERIFALIDTVEQNKTDLETLIKQTKSKILDLAIHGKLVPQDPSDEPASKMLEKLRAEKEEKIATGQLKHDKNDSYIYKAPDNTWHEKLADGTDTEIEVPFEIPESWSWCRLNEIYNFIDYRGVTPTKTVEGVPLVTAKNIRAGYIDYTIKEYIAEKDYEIRQGRGSPQKGDLLFTTEAPLGYCAIADLEKYSPGQRIITFQQYTESELLCNKLYQFFILSDFFQKELWDNKTGTTVSGIKSAKLKLLYIPFPPLEEQKRIVNKIETIQNSLMNMSA